jgi:hypothetical protein
MLNVFIGETLAVWALCEANAFAECAVVGFGVRGVQGGDGMAAGYAYWHCSGVTLLGRERIEEGSSVYWGWDVREVLVEDDG